MTFLFDIGRVLLDFHFEASLARLIPAGHPDPLAALSVLLEKKDEFEKGLIPTEDYIAWALDRLHSPATPEEFIHAWRHIFTPVERMGKTVGKLAADGHRLILFSNTNAIHCPWIFETYEVFRHFPEAILSYEVRSMKPEDAIYRHAIDHLGVVPGSTIYIDDLPENCATGRRLGFRTWQYVMAEHDAFEDWLHLQLAEA